MTYRNDIKAQVTSALTGSPPITARIFWLRAPFDTKSPYIILSIVSETRDMTLEGNVPQARIRLRVDYFGENYNALQNLDAAVRLALSLAEAFSSYHAFATEMFEDDTLLFHLTSEFSLFHPNP